MPHKFNASRRHKFEKRRYRITDWSAYNESLRQRGDVTVWLSPEMAAAWRAERRNVRGGQPVYSDLAITVCLTLGMVYKQPLRQTEGFVRSLVRLMGLDIRVPDYSTFSRRGAGLTLPMKSRAEQDGPIHLVVDSTGLKIFGDIVCSDLTKNDVGDPTALPDLLDQIDADVTRFIADGAYDGDPTSALLTDRFGLGGDSIIPPPKTAVLSPDADGNPTLRDQRIAAITAGGHMAWQVSSGYNQRSRGETLMGPVRGHRLT